MDCKTRAGSRNGCSKSFTLNLMNSSLTSMDSIS